MTAKNIHNSVLSIYILVIYLFYIIQANGHAIGYLML